jgi:hypothetical protein
MQITNHLSTQNPKVVRMFPDGFVGQAEVDQMFQEGPDVRHYFLSGYQVFGQAHPASRPRLSPDGKRLEIRVRARVGSKAICSGCHRPAAGYDRLAERSFEFIPVWGYLVFLLYRMRLVHYQLQRRGRGSSRGRWQAFPHQSLHDLLSTLGAQTVLE